MEIEEKDLKISDKSRFTAGVLQLFCGCIGLGRFYLGFKKYPLLQILASVLTFGIGGVIWGFIDGVLILNGTVKYDCDANILV